jgi:hypothetical protein
MDLCFFANVGNDHFHRFGKKRQNHRADAANLRSSAFAALEVGGEMSFHHRTAKGMIQVTIVTKRRL